MSAARASVWLALVCTLGALGCQPALAAPPTAPAPAPAPAAAPPVARCESCPVDPTAAWMTVGAYDPVEQRSVQPIDIDLFEDGKSILASVTIRRIGALSVSGLKARTPLELVVSAPGYSSQRRRIVLQPSQNSMLFTLGRPGMRYFSQGDSQTPYNPAQTRYIVLMPSPRRGTPGQTGQLLRAYAARAPQVTVKRLAPDPARPLWYMDSVVADVAFTGSDPGRALSDLAHHLRAHPDHGVLAILIYERPTGGTWFTGAIDITFDKFLDPAELLRFADRYGLVLTRTEGARLTFTMRTPSMAFQELIDRIGAENPGLLRDVWPTLDATIETDRIGS